MAPRINQDEWLKELERVSKSNPDGLTTNEWQQRLKINLRLMRQRLKEGIALGLIEFNGMRDSYRMDGIPCKVPVYRVVERKRRG